MRRLHIFFVVAALVALSACGGSGEGAVTNFARGAAMYAIPFLPTAIGETQTLGLQNLSPSFAPVSITAYTPGGVAYGPGTDTILLPPEGAEEFPITNFTGIGVTLGGWLCIDTRDVGTLDPVTGEPTPIATTGLVTPQYTRVDGSVDQDGHGGLVGRSTRAQVTINESTRSVQLINYSFEPMAGGAVDTAVDYDLVIYDAFGTVFSTDTVEVPANGSVQVDTATLELGHIDVSPVVGLGQSAPAGTEYRFGVTALEDDPQVLIETRFLSTTRSFSRQIGVGFDLDWGIDEGGNTHDFGVYMSNPTDQSATVLFRGIYAANGSAILSTFRAVGLDPHATKFMASTTFDSRGLDVGEVSVFDDLFGNVDFATGLTTFEVDIQVSEAVNISARDVDSRFKTYRRILPGYRQTTDVLVPVMNYEVVDTGGTRNFVIISNPANVSQQANIRGFTPGGTEYLLDPVAVGPFSQVLWSPDGTIYREDPTDTTGPPVPHMSFLFSSTGGLYFNARRWRAQAGNPFGLLVFIRPYFVRNLRTE